MPDNNQLYIEGCYWVGSDGEYLERLYFDRCKAINNDHLFIDAFDKNGEHLIAYKLVGDRYTTDF